MNDVKIEKNVPLPKRSRNRRRWGEVIEKFKVGDSILLNDHLDLGSFRAAASRAGYHLVTAQENTKNGETKYRAWRAE